MVKNLLTNHSSPQAARAAESARQVDVCNGAA